jgi:hypothetical protein
MAATGATRACARRGARRIGGQPGDTMQQSWRGVASAVLIALACTARAANATNAGYTSGSCVGCHTGGPSVTLSLTGPATLAPGATGTYLLTITSTTTFGGLDVTASTGTLAVGGSQSANTQLLSGQITQTTRKSEDVVSHDVLFSFTWTAPMPFTSATLTAFGLGANGDGSTNGDTGSSTTLMVAAAATPTPTETATGTHTATATRTATGTATATSTATATASATRTATRTATATSTATDTGTATRTATGTVTATSTTTATASASVTATATDTATATRTATGTATATSTATATTGTPVPEGGACMETAQCEPPLSCIDGVCTRTPAPAPALTPGLLIVALGLLAAIAAVGVWRRR